MTILQKLVGLVSPCSEAIGNARSEFLSNFFTKLAMAYGGFGVLVLAVHILVQMSRAIG